MRIVTALSAVAALCFSLTLIGCSGSSGDVASDGANRPAAQAARGETYGVVLNLTSGKDDPHAVSMGLALAIHSLEHGHETVVFMNVHAPELASKDLGDDVKYADFPPVKEMLATFMEKGGTLFACEHCTGVCGVKTEDLLDGIVVTKHGKLLAALNGDSLVFSY